MSLREDIKEIKGNVGELGFDPRIGQFLDNNEIDLIINKVLDAVIDELRKVRLHKAENVAGCLFTKGSQAQTDVDIAAVKALKEEK